MNHWYRFSKNLQGTITFLDTKRLAQTAALVDQRPSKPVSPPLERIRIRTPTPSKPVIPTGAGRRIFFSSAPANESVRGVEESLFDLAGAPPNQLLIAYIKG
jgi:hypothetical protein